MSPRRADCGARAPRRCAGSSATMRWRTGSDPSPRSWYLTRRWRRRVWPPV